MILAGLAVAVSVSVIAPRLLPHPLQFGPAPPVPVRTSPPPLPETGGGRWLSGAFIGSGTDMAAIERMGRWRGRPLDVLTVYPEYTTWAGITSSTWLFTDLADFKGTLVYGLPIVPTEDIGTLADVAAGRYDDMFATLADQMREGGRGDTIVRVGWEANGLWSTWGASSSTADEFRAAARRVMEVMSQRTPTLIMEFDIACSTPLEGTDNRLAALTELYPGDDVTDVIGCDHYDNYGWQSTTPEGWAAALRSPDSPGLQDVADFARERGKKFAVPEWGLDSSQHGAGDNPRFIALMHEFFTANSDVLLLESYFDEPMTYIGSSLLPDAEGVSQNPRAAEEYVRLWSNPR